MWTGQEIRSKETTRRQKGQKVKNGRNRKLRNME
jgi:hypothetical protein